MNISEEMSIELLKNKEQIFIEFKSKNESKRKSFCFIIETSHFLRNKMSFSMISAKSNSKLTKEECIKIREFLQLDKK